MNMKLFAVGALAAIALSGTAFAAGDAANGEKLAKARCVACHSFDNGGPNKVGPNLFGVVAHGAGKNATFKYSEGFMASINKGLVWDDTTLDEYLKDPTAFLQAHSGDAKARSKMTFKLPKENERADVIAFLNGLK